VSEQLRITIGAEVLDVSAADGPAFNLGHVFVDFNGPLALIVNEDQRKAAFARAAGQALTCWRQQKDRNDLTIRALRQMADVIEGRTSFADELVDTLLRELANA
jgi:hypothetical protein